MGCESCRKSLEGKDEFNYEKEKEILKAKFIQNFNKFLEESGYEKITDEEFNSSIPEHYLKLSNDHPCEFPKDIIEKKFIYEVEPIKFKNGNIFKGKWNTENTMEGKGKYYIKDDKDDKNDKNDIFIDGYWENGELKYGKIFKSDGTIYEGQISDSKYNGEGKLIFKDAVYEGSFENDEFKKGKLKWNNGYEYDGDFNGNTLQGKGKLINPDGDIYEGDFENNYFHGQGKYTYFNSKNLYEGEFEYGMKKGRGKYIANNEYTYEGTWDNDMPFGYGKFSNWDKSCVLKCTFRAGKIAEDPIYEIGSKENFNIDDFEIKPEEMKINNSSLTHLNILFTNATEFKPGSFPSFLSN